MNNTVLIVGGAGGIGTETVRQAVENGSDVVATVRNEAERVSLWENVSGVRRIEIIDLSKGTETQKALRSLCEELKEIRAIACCAGYAKVGFIEFASLNDLRDMVEVNLISNVALFQASMPSLRKTKGNLVLVSSLGGRYVTPTFGLYSASKFALEGAIDAMRLESMRWGVHVVGIQPGWVRTEMSTNYPSKLEAEFRELGEPEQAIFRPILEDMKKLGSGLESAGVPPSAVAKVIIEAMEADEPRARYVVGDDAVEVIRRSREWSEAEIDSDFRKQIPSLSTIL